METIDISENYDTMYIKSYDDEKNNNIKIYNTIESSMSELNIIRKNIMDLISEKNFKDISSLQKNYEIKRSNLILYIIINKNNISEQKQKFYDNLLYD